MDRFANVGDAPYRLRDLLSATGERLGLGDAGRLATLWRSWSKIVGPAVAAHAEPTSLRKGTLRVRTDSPMWATEVSYLGGHIATIVNEVLGDEVVTEVRVWTGPGAIRSEPDRSQPPRAAPARPSPATESDPVSALDRARQAWAKRRRSRP